MNKQQQAIANIRGLVIENFFIQDINEDLTIMVRYIDALEVEIAMLELELSGVNEYKAAKEGK